MNALDANVVVRWITNDASAPHQVRAVEAALAASIEDFFINLVVLAEVAWVLAYTYRVDRAGIAAAVRALLAHPRIRIEERSLVEAAVAAYEAGGAGFADHLIGVLNAARGCATTLTFDKRAAKGPHFSLIA